MPVTGYRKARRSKDRPANIRLALAGPSQSGKTFSAMLLASGLTPPGEGFLMLDTEDTRGLHYTDQFEFEHQTLTEPFHPDKFVDGVTQAAERGFRTVLIDSFSHEWMGVGGILEMAAREEAAGKKRGGQWKEPKRIHHQAFHRLTQTPINIVFCYRAVEKWDADALRPGELTAQTEKNTRFDLSAIWTLSEGAPGVIDYGLPHKSEDQLRPIFQPGRRIDAAMGRELLAWAQGGKPQGEGVSELEKRAREAAEQGIVGIRAFWTKLDAPDRERLRPVAGDLKRRAEESDHNNQAVAFFAEPEPEGERAGE